MARKPTYEELEQRVKDLEKQVSERESAEEALQASEEKFRAFSEAAFEATFLSEKGICLGQNLAAEKMFGYTSSEVIGMTGADWIAPESREMVRNNMLSGYERPYEAIALRKDGSTFPVEIQGKMICYQNREIPVTSLCDITDRVLAEKALRESEEKYRSLFEQSRDAIAITSPRGKSIYANAATMELFGYTKEEMLELNFQRLYVDPDDGYRLQKEMKEKGSAQNFEARLRGKDHVEMDCIFDVVCRRGDDGKNLEYQGIIRDISEAKRAQESLRESELKYRTLFESNEFLLYITNNKGDILLANNKGADFFGQSQETIIGKSFFELRPDRAEMYQDVIDKILSTGETLQFETLYPTPGEDKWLFVTVSPLKIGNDTRLQIVTQEITTRKQTEEALRESETKYRSLHESMRDAFVSVDMDGKVKEFNSEYLKLVGYSEEELIKLTYVDLTPEKWHSFEEKIVEDQILKKGHSDVYEKEYRRKDGTIVPIELRTFLIKDESDKPENMWAIIRDISDRKQAEKALQESEEKYRNILESIEDGYFEVDISGNFTFFNDSLCKILGYSKDELTGMNNRQYTDKENAKKLYQTFNKAYTTGKPDKAFGWEIIRKDGTKIVVEASISLRSDAGGEPIGFRGIVRDISEKKRLESQLQQAQKMEAIATLAGGVAHEFNNTLMGIMGNIELLKMNFSEDGGIDKHLESMKRSGHRMSRLTAQLLAYAEGGKYQPKNLRLDDFVIQTLPILQHDLSPQVRVETHFPKDISHISADNAQMQMILSAILTNSNEAIEDKGIIRITAENKDVDEDFTKQHPGLKPGSYVCLTIEDDGEGMDKEIKDGIFEPFFTTKFQGRGMGMAAVYGIVKNHDGWISVDSEPGKGTTVRIYLPAIEVEIEKPKKAKAEIVTGSGTILMIEDEDVVIEVTQMMLEMLGYGVMVAKTGKDAVHIAETFDGQIDLALLDIKLPDIDGRKLYPRIMKARSNLKVIVCSGYSIDGPAREILDAGAQDFIQKPFSIAKLSEKLKEVLEGK